MKNKFYNTLDELFQDYDEIAYRPAKKGEKIVTHPNMGTGSNENVFSVGICSSNMRYIYARILKKKAK
jgi:hypothetical protein